MPKTKKKKISLVNVGILVLVFCMAVLIGDFINRTFVNTVSPEPIEEVQTDILPLENGGEIKIIDTKTSYGKIVYITMEDLEYVTDSRRRTKKTMENIRALFSRME